MLKSLIDSFYVDDLTLSIPTVEEAEGLISLSEKVIGEAGMRLRKWVTNRSEVSKFLETKKLVESISEGQVGMKVLGFSYQVKEDEIHFDFSTFLKCLAEKDKQMKRIAPGVVSSVYNPLGLVSPVMVELKLAIQDLWKRSLGWDDVLSEESGKTFQGVFREWRKEKLVIPRQFVQVQGRYGIELHSFADASQRVCAVACYGRAIVAGEIKTFLIASKTKLSSLKSGTLPRLELVAALLAARLSKSVEVALGEVVRGSHLWSDSAIVLSWIRSHTANNGQFIQRRLLEIRELTDVNSWYYVPSEENPADIPSRGLRVGDLRECRLWWQGPDFLKHEEGKWLSNEVGKEEVCTTVAVVECSPEVRLLSVVDCRRYSKYSRFVKVVGLLLSVLERLRKMRFRWKERQAENMILSAVQKAGLQEELRFLAKQEGIQPWRGFK